MNSSSIALQLNQRAAEMADAMVEDADELRVAVSLSAGGATLVDCGVTATGGLSAGRLLAEICLAGLGEVGLVPSHLAELPGPAVAVATDQPVAACLASQYAGWRLASGKFFAMASGPMRAAAEKEELFAAIGHIEKPSRVVGVLETAALPPEEICLQVAEDCGVQPAEVTLLAARTSSLAGTLQVVSRSVETTMHKLHELGFPVESVVAGYGVAPLPPTGADDMAAIGLTNDAILYGADVTLWLNCEDRLLEEFGPRVPSSTSSDFGQPFAEIFERYDHDFYAIDPLLFSPARITLVNLASGRSATHGELRADVLRRSLDGAAS